MNRKQAGGSGDATDGARRRTTRLSEIRAASSSSSNSSGEFEDPSVEDYDDFADRLSNDSDQAISGDSSQSDDSVVVTTLGEKYPGVFICLYTIAALIGMFGFFFVCASFLPQQAEDIQKLGKAAQVEKIEKAKVDWRSFLNGLGSGIRIFSDEEIAYKPGGPMYLIIAGHVIDVTSGQKMYGEGGGYHGFIGRDGTLAFHTGKFDDEGFTSDLGEIEPELAKAISGWINFYLNHDTYKFVGLHKGRFFDENGKPLQQIKDLEAQLKIAEKLDNEKAEIEKQFPPCNVEWNADTGSRLWCSENSGGVQRNWIGVPRIFNEREGNKDGARCACVRPKDLRDPRVKEYDNCAKGSIECRVKE